MKQRAITNSHKVGFQAVRDMRFETEDLKAIDTNYLEDVVKPFFCL